MNLRKKFKFIALLLNALDDFKKNDPLRMAGATAFFTTFALPAVLLILIQVFGLLLSPRFMTRQLVHSLGQVVGTNTAGELHKTLFNVRHLFGTWYKALFGFLFLIFVATTLLKVIKDSLNQLWNIRPIGSSSIKGGLISRGKSFAVILVAGILFLIVLLVEGGMHLVRENNELGSVQNSESILAFFRQVVSLLLVTIWFSLLFKFLPDAKTAWKTVIVGGAFTGTLFTFGKLALQFLLSFSSMQTIYGASTSSVLLLLFVFYSSFIFYYGACFTREFAEMYGHPIIPAKDAEKYELSHVEIETGN